VPRDYGNIVGRKPYRPFSSYIPSEYISRTFDKSGNWTGTNIVAPDSFDPLNKDVDLIWAGKTNDTEKFNTYYDYYFTGEDIKVYIDGLFDSKYELDIASFAFLIRQEKQPVYGFWSYNYDVMMVGTRIISGEFSVYSRYPGRMRDLLSEAAKQRAAFYSSNSSDAKVQSYLTGSDTQSIEDEKNIEKYWANSQLDRLASDVNADNRNIFSAHPPFNFVIKYGTQEGSVTTVARNKGTDNQDNFDVLDRLMATDYNERLVQKSSSDFMNIILQSVQLTNMGTTYSVGGQPLVESYQFLARDFYISEGLQRTNQSNSESTASNESASASSTSSNTAPAEPTEEEFALTYEKFRKADAMRRGIDYP
jgi:hypothetical protein